MNIKELYEKIGGNYDDVLTRLMSESFVERFALMYTKDSSYETLMAAVGSADICEQFRAAHSLKGVAANLGFTELSKAAAELTEQLRPQNKQANPELVNTVKAAQQKTIAGLAEYQALQK
ncbi:MAG: Hpt domain-containing protein [Fibrobacter sp.]|nr:Hpt domain-containing protein [Fibrobacter sp.]